MSLGQEQLKRMAELLRVDQIIEYNVLRPAYGFALRVGELWKKVEIDESFLLSSLRDPEVALDCFVRTIFDAAQELKFCAEQKGRRTALQTFIGSARPVEPVEFLPLSTPSSKLLELEWTNYIAQASQITYSGLGPIGLLDVTDLVEDKPKPLNRFEAVAQELENL